MNAKKVLVSLGLGIVNAVTIRKVMSSGLSNPAKAVAVVGTLAAVGTAAYYASGAIEKIEEAAAKAKKDEAPSKGIDGAINDIEDSIKKVDYTRGLVNKVRKVTSKIVKVSRKTVPAAAGVSSCYATGEFFKNQNFTTDRKWKTLLLMVGLWFISSYVGYKVEKFVDRQIVDLENEMNKGYDENIASLDRAEQLAKEALKEAKAAKKIQQEAAYKPHDQKPADPEAKGSSFFK